MEDRKQHTKVIIEKINNYRKLIVNDIIRYPIDKIDDYKTVYHIDIVHPFLCRYVIKRVQFDDELLINYYKKYDNIKPNLGMFIYNVLYNTINDTDSLGGGEIRSMFESFDKSTKSYIDLDYFINYSTNNMELIIDNLDNPNYTLTLRHLMELLDFKIFVIYYLIYGNSNLQITDIKIYTNQGMQKPSITFEYDIDGFPFKTDINNKHYAGLCSTDMHMHANTPCRECCDFETNGLRLYRKDKFTIEMFRPYNVVPNPIKKFLYNTIPPQYIIKNLLNNTKFIKLPKETFILISKFVGNMYTYQIIYCITKKQTFSSHVLCTNNYECPNGKYYKEDGILNCSICSPVLYKALSRKEKKEQKGYKIINIECDKNFCADSLVYDKKYVFLNMDYFIRRHKEMSNYNHNFIKFEKYLTRMCKVYYIYKPSFINENYNAYHRYIQLGNMYKPGTTYGIGVVANINKNPNLQYYNQNEYYNIKVERNKLSNYKYLEQKEKIYNKCQKNKNTNIQCKCKICMKTKRDKKLSHRIDNYKINHLFSNDD
uniref:Uncharacterized protein n=1 Tax=viral metagenome TaxID=1070528 RepID=A0A6C0H8R7_9ZZZZ